MLAALTTLAGAVESAPATPLAPPSPPQLTVSPLQAGRLGSIDVDPGLALHGEVFLLIAIDPQLLSLPANVTRSSVTPPGEWYRLVVPMGATHWEFVTPTFTTGLAIHSRAIVFDSQNQVGTPSNIVSQVVGSPPGAPSGGMTLAEGVALRVRDRSGVNHRATPTTTGVPIAESENILDPIAQLKLVDDTGSQIPAQFAVAARWGNLNDTRRPVKWVHVDFLADLDANQSREYFLTRRDSQTFSPSNMPVTETGSSITIDTGTALFRISKRAGTVFDAVYLDANYDGDFTNDELVIAPGSSSGAVLTDHLGNEYTSANDMPYEVRVVDRGPVRVRVIVKGYHRAANPSIGIGRDFLSYTTWYDFYQGRSDVRVIHTLENDYLTDALGAIGFDDYRIVLDMNLSSASAPYFSLVSGDNDRLRYDRAWPGFRIRTYQEGNGNPATFNRHDTAMTMAGFDTIRTRADGTRDNYGAGSRANGIASIHQDRLGMAVSVRHFWENCPKALEIVSPDQMQLALWPREYPGVHWMNDFQQKTHEFAVRFYNPQLEDPAMAQALVQRDPLRPWAGRDYYVHTGAWSDSGDLPQPFEPQSQWAGIASLERSDLLGLRNSGDDYGWLVFGESWTTQATQTTGSPRNRLMRFYKWAVTGEEDYFKMDEEFALHSSDVRRFQVEGFVASEHPLAHFWGGAPYWNTNVWPDDLGRRNIPASYDPWRNLVPSNTASHDWNGYDYEHMTMDDQYQYYLLSRHPLMLRSLKRVAQGILTFQEVRQPGFRNWNTRGVAWTLRAMLQIYELTAEPSLEPGLQQMFDNWDHFRGGRPNSYAVRQAPHAGALGFPPPGASQAVVDSFHWDAPWQMGPLLHALYRYRRDLGDPTGRVEQGMRDIADYLVDVCFITSQGDFTKFISNTDPTFYNGFYTPLSAWIPGGLAQAYRVIGRTKYLDIAEQTFNLWSGGTRTIPMRGDSWHWWATYVTEMQAQHRM